eukprot:CAMPEP_0201593948 /NCGR_PEP_ID=MMETSP0190_2-20130828/191415_1 /ASSEMBLY_ACC=CAM_ASM_000263 /TAXON_ID=37353 /ORGANISM="Rosalina sp." /LENGTH=511 /DNA_ID=CAMNT_0048053371 /DNA_START=1009 /DNA_END=2544 /DNA_ORIENTATION=+
MFDDDNKDTDIDDDDHSNRDVLEQDNDQDIDMMADDDSDSATPSINNDADNESVQSQGVNNNRNTTTLKKRKKRTKGRRSFQSIEMDKVKQKRKSKAKSKQNRAEKIEKNCQQKKRMFEAHSNNNNNNNNNNVNATPPNTPSMNMNQSLMIDNVSVINPVHFHANDCSDCHSVNNNASSCNLIFDDRTTISTLSNVTPMIPLSSLPSATNSVSVSMSPMRIPMDNSHNTMNMGINSNPTANGAKYSHQQPYPLNYESQLPQANDYRQKVEKLQYSNDVLRNQIQQMRFLLNNQRQHYHRPMTQQIPVQRHSAVHHMQQPQMPQRCVNVNMHQRTPMRPGVHPQYHQQRVPIRRNHQSIRIPARPPPPARRQQTEQHQYQMNNDNLPPPVTMTNTVTTNINNNMEDDEKVLFPDGTRVIDNNQGNVNTANNISNNHNNIRNDDEFTMNGFIPPNPIINMNNNGLEASVEPFTFNHNLYNQSSAFMTTQQQSPDINLNSSSFLNLHYEATPGL